MPLEKATAARRQENQSRFRYRTSGTSRGRTFNFVQAKCGVDAARPICRNSLSHVPVSVCAHIADRAIAHIGIHRPVAHVSRIAHVCVHARVHVARAHVGVQVRSAVIGRGVHHVRIA